MVTALINKHKSALSNVSEFKAIVAVCRSSAVHSILVQILSNNCSSSFSCSAISCSKLLTRVSVICKTSRLS